MLLCLGARAATAGNITINMTSTVEYRDGALAVDLTVSNLGDEAARSVVPIVRFLEREARGERREALGPRERLQASLAVPAPGLGAGRWPFRVAVDYTDANQYPFQALHVALLTVGNPSPAKVAVPEISIPALSRTTTARLTVKNLAGTARTAAVTVFAPEDLEVAAPRQDLELPAWGERTVRASLTNRTALAGSRYPVFVAVEYDDTDVHQALVAQGLVEILSPRAFVSRWLLWAVAALVLGWLLLLAWRGRRARRA
jgi:hypothetical protein